MTDRKTGKATGLVEGGRRKEWRRRLVNVPVERASTILFDNVDELQRARPGLGQWNYGLQGTETHWALSEALTELEPGAAGTALYSSGLAAVTGALLAVLSTGDELLVVDCDCPTLSPSAEDGVGLGPRGFTGRRLARLARPEDARCPAQAARGKCARGCALAEGQAGRRAGASSRLSRLPRPRILEARLQ